MVLSVIHLQKENLEMVVKGGKHRLVGYVDLGPLHDDMHALEGRHRCP